jgi:hypothetical protein
VVYLAMEIRVLTTLDECLTTFAKKWMVFFTEKLSFMRIGELV